MKVDFDAYETVIGFECHVQLKTKSKLFSPGENRYGALANSLVDVVDIGLPGVLPTLNKKAVEFAIKLGLSLNCKVNTESIFSRKHYFYPDLPKGYQISQFDRPILENGHLEILLNGQKKSIRIRRIHIEEDAGKNIHIEGQNASYVDFNRAGTPLLEVVTEPDIRSPEEAVEAFKRLRQMVIYLGICDGNMQEGSLRADLNVSVRKKGDKNLGTRTETKNLNSFKFLSQATVFESRRQILELESGKKIIQETRLWDPNLKESRSLRTKEDAEDYRYFPDPDLLPLRIASEEIEKVKISLPEPPLLKLSRYQDEYGLKEYDAAILSEERSLANYFEDVLKIYKNPKITANWIINEILKVANTEEENNEFNTKIKASSLAELLIMLEEKKISSNQAKKALSILEKEPNKSPKDIVKENAWQILSDENELLLIIKKIIDENPLEVEKYKAGKTKVLGFLMGEVMKQSKGQAEPKLANKLMFECLDKKT